MNAPNTNPCNDGNACTQTDTCNGVGGCVGSNPVVCGGGDQCNDPGTCSPGTGTCSPPTPKPNGTACSDSNACTQTDVCEGGTCTGTAYSWSGVLAPIKADGSSVFNLGAKIPVKFRLTGACAGNPNLVANIYFYKLPSTGGPVTQGLFEYNASADQYSFNLSTKGLSTGTWAVGIDLHDGVGIRVVTVRLR